MAQDRSIEFKQPDASYKMNRHTLTGTPAGLYFGFDANFSGMELRLNHAGTGFEETDINGVVLSRRGLFKSRQGVVVLEGSDVTFTIAPTTSTTRRDAIVASHAYQNIIGGGAATYSVKPNIGSGEPILSPYEVLLGILELPINCTSLTQSGVRYVRRQILDLNTITSLVAGKYDIVQPTSINVNTFDAGWNAGFGNALLRYRRDQRGRVYLEGSAECQTTNANVFVLPAGYRPQQANHRSVIVDNSGGLHVVNISGITGQVSFAGTPVVNEIYWFNNIAFFTNA